MEVYAYLDRRILPDAERQSINYWLQSADIKVRAALEAGDELKAAFIVGTTSWTILERVWAVSDGPMPPSSGVSAHLADLTSRPPLVTDWFAHLFLGDTPTGVETTLNLIGWLVPLL